MRPRGTAPGTRRPRPAPRPSAPPERRRAALGARALLTGRRARRLGRAHQALTADVEVLQAALVPGLAGQIGATDISVAYRPADGLASGGDFYDAFALDDDRTAIILGDVSGH